MKRIPFFLVLILMSVGLMAQGAVSNMHNGHEYVDLDLPSGTLWATCNIGAIVPEGYGDYFAWGETSPKGRYDWITYQYGKAYNALTKYCANNAYGLNGFVDHRGTLESVDDAANVNWGHAWRMPTATEQQELRENCVWEWTTQNDVYGYKITGKNGNSIFLPAAGYRYDAEVNGVGKSGYYLSSSFNEPYANHAYYLYFRADKQTGNHISRYYGQTIRPVYSGKQDEPVAVLEGGTAVAQPRSRAALGANIGFCSGFSYQHSIGESNMIDFSLNIPLGSGIGAILTYDWVNPFGAAIPWTEKGAWNWNLGVGATGGIYGFTAPVWYAGAAGHVGVAYDFWFPLQLSLDYRPNIGVICHMGYFAFNVSGLYDGISLGVRYLF